MRAHWKLSGLLTALLMHIPAAHAFLTIGESGDVTPKNVFKIGAEPQLRTSNGSGGNVGVFIDSGVREDMSWRAQIGTGDTDFWAGGSVKWIPIPDYDQQPAIGGRIEANFGRDANESFTVFRIAPLISKGFNTEIGRFTPYAALPLGIWAMKGTSENISQFVIGSEAKLDQSPDFLFSAELGFDMSKSFSYIAGTVTYFFNESNLGKKR